MRGFPDPLFSPFWLPLMTSRIYGGNTLLACLLMWDQVRSFYHSGNWSYILWLDHYPDEHSKHIKQLLIPPRAVHSERTVTTKGSLNYIKRHTISLNCVCYWKDKEGEEPYSKGGWSRWETPSTLHCPPPFHTCRWWRLEVWRPSPGTLRVSLLGEAWTVCADSPPPVDKTHVGNFIILTNTTSSLFLT